MEANGKFLNQLGSHKVNRVSCHGMWTRELRLAWRRPGLGDRGGLPGRSAAPGLDGKARARPLDNATFSDQGSVFH